MKKETRVEQWRGLKFGMFLHYGLYSVLGRGEWAMFNEPIDKDDYARLAAQFTAQRFDGAALEPVPESLFFRFQYPRQVRKQR